MKKLLTSAIALILITPVFAGGVAESQPEATSEPTVFEFYLPTGFPAISLAEFVVDQPDILEGYSINYSVVQSPDLLGAKLLSGEADMVVAPTNLGANLYNLGVDLRYVGSVVWGILYVVTTEDIQDWDDLRGKEISMLGRGLTPDILFRHIMEENGIDPETDVTLNYVQNTTELAPTFISGKSTISIMPEPALSMVLSKVPDARVFLDLQQEWARMSGSSESYPQASLFVTAEVAEHPEFLDAFIEAYAASVERALVDTAVRADLAAEFLTSPPAAIIAEAIPRGNLRWVPASEARPAVEEYLGVVLGGAVPDDGFYR